MRSSSLKKPAATGLAKYRLHFGYATCLATLLFARRELLLPGIGVAVLGIALRIWASGYLRKDAHVTTGGPYAFMRNPLYVGSFLFGIGSIIAIRAWWLLAVYVVGFFIFYYPTMRSEEAFLLEKFGGEFEAYRKRVPLFFPWKPGSGEGRFSLSSVKKNAEHRFALGLAAFLLILEAVVRLRAFLGR